MLRRRPVLPSLNDYQIYYMPHVLQPWSTATVITGYPFKIVDLARNLTQPVVTLNNNCTGQGASDNPNFTSGLSLWR